MGYEAYKNGVISPSEIDEVSLAARHIKSFDTNDFIGIKEKERVKALGEVFTPENIVIDMTDLDGIKQLSYTLDSTFLEPSCGTGNFLVELLARKLSVAIFFYQNNEDKDKTALDIGFMRAVASIYGIDIMVDNVYESKSRLLNMCSCAYQEVTGEEMDKSLYKSIQFIVDRNIILGDAMKKQMLKSKALRKIKKNSLNSLDNFEGDTVEWKVYEWKFDGETVQRIAWAGDTLDICLAEAGIDSECYDPVHYLSLYKQKDICFD